MNKKINCILPIRSGSQRIKNKNIRRIGNFKLGLFEIKFNQLLKSKKINKIIVSTNEKKIIKFLNSNNFSKEIVIDLRPEFYCSNSISTDELINYIASIIPNEDILWTHVTSPFINEKIYDQIIDFYYKKINKNKYDSLATAHVIKNYLWKDQKPLNYDIKKEKWPATQNLKPIYELDSGVFISSKKNYLKFKNRIGLKPYFYELNKINSTDVDWEDDFNFVKMLIEFGIK